MTVSRTPSLNEVLDLHFKYRVGKVHVAIPGRIEAYHLATQKADVKPLIQHNQLANDGSSIVDDLPVIQGVPVVFPRGGGFFLSFPLAVGDHVLLVFSDFSIDKWVTGAGDVTDPIDTRNHHLSDAVAIPGCYPFSKALADAHATRMVLGDDAGMQIAISTTQVLIGNAAKSAVLFEDLKAEYDLHTHPTAFGPSGDPTVDLTNAVRSDKVKLPSN